MTQSSASPTGERQRGQFSHSAAIAYGIVAAALFSASSSAPTPVYHLYQEALGLSPVMLMTIFSAYAFSLLAALLTIGSLSDYIGRKPVIFSALLLNLMAMAVFAEASSAGMLVLARALQGFATGAAMTTMGAAILDFDKTRGPVINSLTAFIGLTAGSLVSGILVTYAPLPTQLIYIVLFAVTLALTVLLYWLPESTQGKAGAWASLKPHVAIPTQTRRALLKITPVNIAGWALGGFYFSLMPTLIRVATGVTLPVFGGVIVAILTLTATFTALALKSRSGPQVLAIGTVSLISGVAVTLVGVYLHLVPIMLIGAMITGVGFGSCYSGALRIVLPLAHPDERAGLLSTFFVQSYLAFSLPTIAVGLVAPSIGLSNAAYLYGGIVILLATISLAAMRPPRREPSAA